MNTKSWSLRILALALSAPLVVLGACGPTGSALTSSAPGAKAEGSGGDEVNADDGFDDWPVEGGGGRDAAGHPVGARVFEAEDRCLPAVGSPLGFERWRLRPSVDQPGTICTATLPEVGRGRFIVNLRGATAAPHACRFDGWPQDQPCPEGLAVVEIAAYDGDSGVLLGSHTVRDTDYWRPLVFEDRSLTFDLGHPGPVRVEVRWHGAVPLRFDYVEVFRPDHQLVLDPPSGALSALGAGAVLRMQLEDPDGAQALSVSCNGVDQTTVLDRLLADGDATDQRTDFRRVVKIPLDELLSGCARPTLLRVTATKGSRKVTRRMTVLDTPPACDWLGAEDAEVKVLLTGFEPFPAASSGSNASGEAVRAVGTGDLEADLRDRVALMRVVIPVEWDTAPAWIEELIARCEPDVVISFGQGGGLDIETTSYNLKDASTRSWQVDNRGLIFAGSPIVAGGPSKRMTTLPAEAIVAALQAAGFASAETSTDPGRYICNNTFYYTSHAAEQLAATRQVDVGFVHLPPDRDVSDAERAELARLVGVIVSTAARPRLEPVTPASND